jgi:RNA polymerase sigma-70 factor (ECF subfamily)
VNGGFTATLEALSPLATSQRAGIVRVMHPAEDDAALMARYARGDLAAFTQLYEHHKESLYRYLLRLTRHHAAADDLFQEVWSRVIASRERYEPRAKFSTFLFSIGHNCFIDYCRRNANSPSARAQQLESVEEMLADSSHRGPDRLAESAQAATRFRAALEGLPTEQREVFLLHEEAGLSLEEIGKLTGVGMETAKSRLRYAVAKLRLSLIDEAPAAATLVPQGAGRGTR